MGNGWRSFSTPELTHGPIPPSMCASPKQPSIISLTRPRCYMGSSAAADKSHIFPVAGSYGASQSVTPLLLYAKFLHVLYAVGKRRP